MYQRVGRSLTILFWFSSVALIMASCAQGDALTNAVPVQQGGAGTSEIAQGTNTNAALCGNGVIETDPVTEVTEECDLTDLGGSSCDLLGYAGGGTLGCLTDCTYDTGACLIEGLEPDAASPALSNYGNP
jgi:hypothetical protein